MSACSAVEMFVARDTDGREALIVNEIAPRVHNSGHWTIDGAQTSQFEQHIRAIAGWPLGAPTRRGGIEMHNLIGEDAEDWRDILAQPDLSLHLYGKLEIRPGPQDGPRHARLPGNAGRGLSLLANEGRPVSRFWSSLARDLSPYVPGEQPRLAGLVKLNTNESPFGPSPKVIEAIRAAADDALRLYPDPRSTRLREALAQYHSVAPEQVFVGNGSDEVLAHAFAALLKQAVPLLFPDVTYSFYPVYCRLLRIDHETVPLDAEMRVRVDDYLGRRRPGDHRQSQRADRDRPSARRDRAAGGGARRSRRSWSTKPTWTSAARSAVPLIGDHPNLLVVQTMSKSRALAGLRVGYAIGDAGLIEALTRVKDSFNSYPLGRPAEAGAIASIEDEAYFQRARSAVMRNRDDLTAG